MKRVISLILTLALNLQSALGDDLKPSLTFGLLLCQSGPCAFSGENALHGVTLAAEDLNKSGGILGKKVQFAIEDSQDAITGAKAVTAYHSLRRNKEIHYFIGPCWTPGLLAIAPIASRDPQVVITTHEGGVKEFNEAGPNLFNTRGVDESISREIARAAFNKGARTFAIFGSQQAWELAQGAFFEDEIKKLGGTVVAKVEPIPSLPDLNAEALKVVNKKPDAILFSAYTQLDLALKAVSALNYPGIKMAAFIDDSRINLSGNAIEGVMTLTFLNPSEEFSERLKKSFPSTEPSWSAHTAYDTIMVYAEAMKLANSTDIKDVLPKISEVKMKEGKSGSFVMGPERIAIREKGIYKIVKDGKLTQTSN